jgi:hypothetical protein
MRIFLVAVLAVLVVLLVPGTEAALAQKPRLSPRGLDLRDSIPVTPGKKLVEDAFAYQRKLMRGLVTLPDAVANWSKTAKDPEVRKDRDALAIAYGCEGLMLLEQGETLKADSALTLAMPLFKYRKTKAYFIVALAGLDKKLSFYEKALGLYDEILHEMDSLPELDDISFYHASGYAPYAYGIDAALGTALIGGSKEEFRDRAVFLLRETAARHTTDALGAMSYVALAHIDKSKQSEYKFNLDLLCSRKPELRKAADNFDQQFEAIP